jgi:hypothetical protein
MFEKIFGIFRKRKKADISQDIPGDAGEDLFDVGDAEFGDDFDADTISLETGMSDGGFSTPSGDVISDEEIVSAEPVSGEEGEDEFGAFDDYEAEEEMPGAAMAEEGMSPLPEVEPEVYAPPKARRGGKGILVIIIVVLIGLVAGFFLSTDSSIEMAKRIISSEPTLLEQLETLRVENEQLNGQLKKYRAVGTIDEILAVKAELKKRNDMTAEIEAIENKVADRPAVEGRLAKAKARLSQTERDLVIHKGSLANVQKALKQIEARNNYFVVSTNENLDQIREAGAKSEVLKARLEAERIQRAETNAFMSRDVQEGVERTALEALSSM